VSSRRGADSKPQAATSTWEDDEPTTVIWAPPDWLPEEGEAATSEPLPTSERPAVEVDVRSISGAAAVGAHARRAFEIWTRNRVYALDGTLECIEVIDLATGRSNPHHPFLGARLVGGQTRSEQSNELSFPLPVPGSDAVFQKFDRHNRIRLSVTSRVTRVLLHVHRVMVTAGERDNAWSTLTRTGS
jgi:hypothetical protein